MPRILVLDDEPLIAALMKDWLSELDCETVGPAHSVDEALDLFSRETMDGAILDVSLGGEDCYPVADALRGAGIPVAFSTGYGADVLPPRFKEAIILSKPFAFAAVREAVATLAATHAKA